MSIKYENFNEQKVEIIAKELIRSGILFSVGISSALYQKVQRIATKLGYMDIKPMDLGNAIVLENEDYLKIVDKIWEYITSGILAPGSDWNNSWFPHLHLTEKGKKFIEEKSD